MSTESTGLGSTMKPWMSTTSFMMTSGWIRKQKYLVSWRKLSLMTLGFLYCIQHHSTMQQWEKASQSNMKYFLSFCYAWGYHLPLRTQPCPSLPIFCQCGLLRTSVRRMRRPDCQRTWLTCQIPTRKSRWWVLRCISRFDWASMGWQLYGTHMMIFLYMDIYLYIFACWNLLFMLPNISICFCMLESIYHALFIYFLASPSTIWRTTWEAWKKNSVPFTTWFSSLLWSPMNTPRSPLVAFFPVWNHFANEYMRWQ